MVTKTFEQMIADAVRLELDNRGVSSQSNPERPAHGITAAYTAEPPAKIDGQITLADGLEALVIGGAGVGCGVLAGLGHLLLFREPGGAAELVGGFALAGSMTGFARLLLDALNPLALFRGWWDYRQAVESGEWAAFQDWQDEQRYKLPRQVQQSIRVELIDDRGNMSILGFDGEQAERVQAFARQYCSLLDSGEDYPTAEKFYVGSGLIWSNSPSGGDSGRAGWDALKRRLLTPLYVGGERRHLAYEKGGRWHLTPTGKRVLRGIAADDPPAPPDA